MPNGEEIKICSMEEAHLDQVTHLESVIFTEPWSRRDFEQELLAQDHRYFVALMDPLVIGYCGYWGVAGEGHIYNVAVKQEYRSRSIGRRMLEKLIADGKEHGINDFTLEVRAGNAAAIQLYHGLGFEDAGLRKDFYRKPAEDALIMWKRSGDHAV